MQEKHISPYFQLEILKLFKEHISAGHSKGESKEKTKDSFTPAHHLALFKAFKKEIGNTQRTSEEAKSILKQYESKLNNFSVLYEYHKRESETELERLRNIKKGDRGEPGIAGKDAVGIPGKDGKNAEGLPGKDGIVDEKKIIESLLTFIKREQVLDLSHIKGATGFIKNGIEYKFEELMHGGGSSKGGSTPKSADLSLQCNGSNLIFTIPTFTTILSLMGTDAPIIYRPTIDFTATGTTLTMATSVNAPSAGATLILTYV